MDVSETGPSPLTPGVHPPVVADAQSDSAPPTRQTSKPTPGSAAGANTTWSKTPVAPARTSAPQVAGAPPKPQLRLASIDRAYTELEKAWQDLKKAQDEHARVLRRIPPQSTLGALNAPPELLEKAEAAASFRHQEKLLILREANRAEAERLSAPSTLSPQARDPAAVRRAEEQIASQYSGWKNRVILNANRANQEDRVLVGLSNVSEAMSKGKLTDAQELEMLATIEDASDFVTGRRLEERSLPAEQVTIQRFDRFKDLLKKVQAVDATFDRTLLATVIIRCANEMDLLTTDDLARLHHVVGDGNIEVNSWIAQARYDIQIVRLNLSEIKQALEDHDAARSKLNVARARRNDASRAQLGVESAKTRLREAIRRETGRLLPETKGLPHHRDDVGWLERRMIAALATSLHHQGGIREAIKDRLFPSLGVLSDLLKVSKATREPLNLEEEAKANWLVADTARWAAEPRANDGREVGAKQFERLKELLDHITKTGGKFDPDLFELLVAECKRKMAVSSRDELMRFNEIVAVYRKRLDRK
jgi:hypothetical protein